MGILDPASQYALEQELDDLVSTVNGDGLGVVPTGPDGQPVRPGYGESLLSDEEEADRFLSPDERAARRAARKAQRDEEQRLTRQTHVLITIAGWITYGEDDFTLPFSLLRRGLYGDQYSLVWESQALQDLGSALRLLVSEIAGFIFQQGLHATLLPVLMAGLTGPLWMLKLTYLMDNPWGIGLSKAKKAGRLLADTLMQNVQGSRPVTLIGFSLGARVIFNCLEELAAHNAYGLVESCYIYGCPVMAGTQEWRRVTSVVAGRFVNGYLQNDWVLGVLYRASNAAWNTVAGLRPIMDVPGVENLCLDGIINGHLEYR
ncbi:hypothetical protein CXG81DRAFT_15443, partial [Caulochytrium protostelioides]